MTREPPAATREAYLAEVITRIVNGHPNGRIDELLPWADIAAPALKDVA